MKTKLSERLPFLAVAALLAGPPAMIGGAAHAEISGNVSVVSKYVLRGIYEENSGAAIQGGIDYAAEGGLYAGWWASSLGYTYNADGDPYTSTGMENDFYAGYAGSVGAFSYTVGLIQYYYLSVDDSDLTELLLSAGYGPVSLNAQYLLRDGVWGNAGDTYFTLNYATDLPAGLGFAASLGYYLYDDDDAGNSKASFTTVEDSAFRHLNFTLSSPIADTGAEVAVTYIVAGKDREGVSYDDTMVLSVSYAF